MTFGASLTLDVETQVNVAGEVDLRVGTNISLKAFSGKLDMKNKVAKAENFLPTFTPLTFNASGQVEVRAALATPVGLGFGIEIPCECFPVVPYVMCH